MAKNTLRIALIKARWHADIVDQVHAGFLRDMKASGAAHDVTSFDVPGEFEKPLLAKRLGQSDRFDAIVVAALVVDGGIYRHHFVAEAAVSGLTEVQLHTGVPAFSVSLTPHNFQPSKEHHDFFFRHFLKKGSEAAQAVCQVTMS